MDHDAQKTALVVGGAGFMGSHLCDRLLFKGWAVTCVDDLSTGFRKNVEHVLQHPRFRFIDDDVTRLASHLGDLGKPDVIYVLASRKIPRHTDALDTLEVNIAILRAGLEMARGLHATVVFSSTSDVYGQSEALPFSEDGVSVLGPSTSRRWSYAASKLYGEHLVLAYLDRYGVPGVVTRIFGSYGPRMRLDWWAGPHGVFIDRIAQRLTVPIHGDGQQTRSFTYVEDTAEMLTRCATAPGLSGEIVNIGGAGETGILDMALAIHELLGLEGPPAIDFVPYETLGKNYQDVRRRVPDTRKAQAFLGDMEWMLLREGLRRTIAWYKALAPADREQYRGASR